MATTPLARAKHALGFGALPRPAAKPPAATKAEAAPETPAETPEEDARRARLEGESDDDYAARMAELDEEEETEERDEEDETDREEMRGNTAAAQARARATARCLAIFGHPAAAANMPLALKLAASSMGRHEACAILAEAPAPRADKPKGQLSQAMEEFGSRRPGPGAVAAPAGPQAVAASWDHALKRAGIATR